MREEVLDFNYILEFCEVGKTSPQNVGKNLLKLEEFYTKDEIVSIYEFFLTNISDSEILIQVIKQSDSYRTGSILKLIIEILEKRGGEDDSNINLRALCARAISNYKDMFIHNSAN